MINEFKDLYNRLNRDNINDIRQFYASDILFIDPFKKVKGLDNLEHYFSELYGNVKSINFDFSETISQGNNHAIIWQMHVSHEKINRGLPYSITGSTHLKTNSQNQIIYHRDYFDAGSMIYEKLPLIGLIIRWIKKKI